MTETPSVDNRPDDSTLAHRNDDGQYLVSTPVLVAAAVVVVALVVGAFLLGRSSGTTETSPATSTSVPSSQLASDPLSQALELHNAGQLDQALVIYQELLLAEPTNQYALYNIGLINQTRDSNEVAIDYYDRALAANPAFAVAAYNRALALRDVGRIDESLAAFEALLNADGDNVGVLYNYGNLLISQGEVEQGTELVNRAIELDPSLRGD